MANSAKSVVTLEELCYGLSPGTLASLWGKNYHGPSALPLDSLCFTLPDASQIAALFLALLKFELPPQKHFNAYRRFVTQLLATPRAGKRELQKLHWPSLEWLSQQLCLQALKNFDGDISENTPINSIDKGSLGIILKLLAIELQEFNLQSIVQGDIALLAEEDASRLHSYYYQEQTLTAPVLKTILDAHGFDDADAIANSSWLSGLSELSGTESLKTLGDDDATAMLAYWCVRRLSYPLPWKPLLEMLCQNKTLWERMTNSNPLINDLLNENLKDVHLKLPTTLAFPEVQKALNALSSDSLEGIERLETSDALCDTLWSRRPYARVILVEGTTEAILLPLYARLYHACLPTESAKQEQLIRHQVLHTQIIPVGGKNQMASVYKSLQQELRIPIAILLDADAEVASQQIGAMLRAEDCLEVISTDCKGIGEIEDLYDLEILLTVIEQVYKPHPSLTPQTFQSIVDLTHETVAGVPGIQKPKGRVAQLRLIWQVFGLGKFDKVELAQHMAQHMAQYITQAQAVIEKSQKAEIKLPAQLSSLVESIYALPVPTHQRKIVKL